MSWLSLALKAPVILKSVLPSIKKELESLDIKIDVTVSDKIYIIGHVNTPSEFKAAQLEKLKALFQSLQKEYPDVSAMIEITLVIGKKRLLLLN